MIVMCSQGLMPWPVAAFFSGFFISAGLCILFIAPNS